MANRPKNPKILNVGVVVAFLALLLLLLLLMLLLLLLLLLLLVVVVVRGGGGTVDKTEEGRVGRDQIAKQTLNICAIPSD